MSSNYDQFFESFKVYGFDLNVMATFELINDKQTLTQLSMVCPVFEIYLCDLNNDFIDDFINGAACHDSSSYYHIKNEGDDLSIKFTLLNSDSIVVLPIDIGEKIHAFLKQSLAGIV